VLRGEVDELGDKFGGFAETSQGFFFYIAGPIHNEAGELTGVVMTGQPATTLAETIRQQTLAQVSFYDLQGNPLTTSLTAIQPIDVTQVNEILARQEEGSFQRGIVDSGIEYRELLVTLEVREGEDVGLMGLALPENFIAQTSQITRSNTYVLIGTGLFLAIVVGVVVAGRITRPIQDLKQAAQRVAQGDLEVKVNPRGQDEVGILSNSFNLMVDSLNESQKELISTYNKTIEGWARALDLRDHETEGHSRRVADLSVELAAYLGLKGEELEHIRRGALLHDIGKIAIPDSILLKEGKLTEAEIGQMRQHPVYAQLFMGEIEFLKPAMDIPVSHHEKWDGSGYPKGLRGEEIPFAARIFAIVDVWDALTSDRPYRTAMKRSEALAYIESESNRHFDPKVAAAFKQLINLIS
jgi:HAMP domain-containing protein